VPDGRFVDPRGADRPLLAVLDPRGADRLLLAVLIFEYPLALKRC
jgi:hypothetical protein